MKHKLTAVQADEVRAATGFSRGPGESPEDNPGPTEGDSYDALPLPNGNRLILLGVVNGSVVGLEVERSDDEDEPVFEDEAPERVTGADGRVENANPESPAPDTSVSPAERGPNFS